MNNSGKKTALFGGTFNPVHLGHLRAAMEVAQAFEIDEMVFIPSNTPPHKMPEVLADSADRFKMLQMAVASVDGWSVSDVEIKRHGPSYTVDTVKGFLEKMGKEDTLFFIMGMDAFAEIDTWKSCEELFGLVSFIVMARPGSRLNVKLETSPDMGPSTDLGATHGTKLNISMNRDTGAKGRRELAQMLKQKVDSGYKIKDKTDVQAGGRPAGKVGSIVHESLKPVYYIDVTPLDVSSTRIRKMIVKGESIKYLVVEAVESYISTKNIYR